MINTNKLMTLLPDMAVFVLVVDSGSFSAAATELSMTPSAVSRQIARLEKALEVQLLQRTTRRQQLTAEGELAYAKCRAIIDSGREVSQIGNSAREVAGDIRLAAPKAYSRHILQPLVHEFMAQHPQVNIHFSVTDVFMNPQRDDIDLAVRLSNSLIEGLVNKPLHPLQSVIVATQPYLARQGKPDEPDQLTAHSCLRLSESSDDSHWRFVRGQQQKTVSVSGRYSNNHSEMRLAAVEQHLGIGILPEFVAAGPIAQGRVVPLLTDWQLQSTFQGQVCLQYAQNRFMPNRLRCFIDFLSERLHTSAGAQP